MNFHEKNAWACGAADCLVYIPYFSIVLRNPMAFDGLFIIAVGWLIVILVGFHVANAIATPAIRETGSSPVPDELDRIIELRAAKLSGIVLTAVVVIWSIVALFGMPGLGVGEMVMENSAEMAAISSDFAVPVTQAVFWIHLLFAGLVIANVTYYGSIVVAYRRLANG